jgi:large subunit ribosomal protein L18
MKLEQRIAKQRQNRRFRVRNRLRQTAGRPRLTVFRSNKHMYAQIVDDQAGATRVAASTAEVEIRGDAKAGGNKAAATKVGQMLAARALERGIKQVVFDRAQYRYHGRVAALAEAARAAGLEF